MRAFLIAAAISAAALFPTAPATAADLELSFYGGTQSAPHSNVSGSDPTLGDFDFRVKWEGKSFDNPPYYGVRAMWWQPSGWGFGVEANHAKVYASNSTRANNGLDVLEFTDGLNLITVNAFKRFTPIRKFTPYVGAGIGLSVPHVEVTPTGGSRTFEYQVAGPAIILVAGVSYDLGDKWAVFGEYKGSYTQNEVDLEGGGNLETNIVTNALNIGVTYKF